MLVIFVIWVNQPFISITLYLSICTFVSVCGMYEEWKAFVHQCEFILFYLLDNKPAHVSPCRFSPWWCSAASWTRATSTSAASVCSASSTTTLTPATTASLLVWPVSSAASFSSSWTFTFPPSATSRTEDVLSCWTSSSLVHIHANAEQI